MRKVGTTLVRPPPTAALASSHTCFKADVASIRIHDVATLKWRHQFFNKYPEQYKSVDQKYVVVRLHHFLIATTMQ
jgi:hypothetical protein